MDRVLVIGAGGFVGGAILRAIAGAPGLQPVAGVRNGRTRMDGIAELQCEATDAASLERTFQGMAYVVLSVLGRSAMMIAATSAVHEAARRAGVRRLVLISTASVYGPAEGLVDETAKLDGSLGRYAAAKVACERITGDGVNSVTLRPSLVFGPGGEQWAGRLARLLWAGRLGDLGAMGDGFCNLVDADDVGAAAVQALIMPGLAGQAFNVGPPDPQRWNVVLTDYAWALGVPRLRRIPSYQLQAEAVAMAPVLHAARVAGARLGLRAGAWPEPIPPSLLRLMRQEIRLDHRRADRMLGFARTPLATSLARAAAWFATTRPDVMRQALRRATAP